ALPAVTRALALEVQRAGAAVQLTLAQFSSLRLLARRDCSVTELAQTLNVTLPTATRIVDALVNKGLAERFSSRLDRRHVLLRITSDGRQVENHCRLKVESYLADLLDSWPQERQRELAQALEEMLAASKVARDLQRV
ncbi:MAG: MarR family transcriptional regulator, partial [Dehalococcoidia bacterium]